MKFYGTVESMRTHPPAYSDPFILQWEIPAPKDGVERKYVVFDGITEYLKYHSQGRYNTCHEVFLSQTYNVNDDVYGHPAFDIDMKISKDSSPPSTPDEILTIVGLSPEWEKMLQEDIITILCKQYPTMEQDITRILSPREDTVYNPWIWMTSPSLHKISKHLVISKVCFSMWRTQMKLLTKDLVALNRPYSRAIDEGILRKLGSLRLPLNSKRHTYGPVGSDGAPTIAKISHPLIFDDPSHKFTDGIVLIHDANMYTMENGIVLTPSDLSPEYQQHISNSYGIYQMPSLQSVEMDECTEESLDELINAFNRIDKLYQTGLVPGKKTSKYLSLVRKRSGTCPISGRVHDGDNAFVYMKNSKIFFSCHRGCSIKIAGTERKYIDITPWKGDSREDIARLANSDIERSLSNRDES